MFSKLMEANLNVNVHFASRQAADIRQRYPIKGQVTHPRMELKVIMGPVRTPRKINIEVLN